MSGRHLHIIELDVPYPPDYGAAIDMYNRAKCLHEMGIKVTMHCFDYGRGRPKELNEVCNEIFYYPRQSAIFSLFSSEPYIVHSRRNKELFNRIFADDSPVLMEGTHTCAALTDDRSKKKKMYVRMHNIEEDYYRHLADAAPIGTAKWYYSMEAKRLRQFEPKLSQAAGLFSVSEKDHKDLSARFKHVEYVPPFIYNDVMTSKTGKGTYALYHGNLMVEENLKAAKYVIDEIFNELPFELVIAGKGTKELSHNCKNDKIRFVESPGGDELFVLIQNAHVNVLPTFQPTGIKHKLINSLLTGRWCVVNPPMVDGNGLDKFCVIAKDATEMRKAITDLFQKDFTEEEITKRKSFMETTYSNRGNAEKMIKVIFGSL